MDSIIPDINARERLEKIKSPLISLEELEKLYAHLMKTSDLSAESILHEIESALSRLSTENFLSITLDRDELSLTIEELAFLLEYNRYQEKESSATAGKYSDIEVHGIFGQRHIFFISETTDLIGRTIAAIEDITREKLQSPVRLYSYSLIGNPETGDYRRLYLLEFDEYTGPESPFIDGVKGFINREMDRLCISVEQDDIADFIKASPARLIEKGIANPEKRGVEDHFLPWIRFRGLLKRGEDILITIESHPGAVISAGALEEKRIQLWLPREKFQENFKTINKILERRGIFFTRQYFESFQINGRDFILLTTYTDCRCLGDEVEEFIKNELYNRLVLLRSAPFSIVEVKGLLDRIRSSREYEKLYLIDEMQKNRRKEYLVPLVVLLNDGCNEIRKKSFGLIKNYLLNPTTEMKNDYYWSTLKNIFSAATVPFQRERDRLSRPLTDEEIIQLIKFRDIHYEDYHEPLSGSPYLFIRINGIGIGKGGIRADKEHVSFSGEGALSTNMLFKSLGLGIPWYTTGKGGILGDLRLEGHPEEKRTAIRENILKAYGDFLYYRAGIGPLSDVPAGDVGIGAEEVGVIFDRVTDNVWQDIRLMDGDIQAGSRQGMILKENFGIDTGSPALMEKLSKDREEVMGYTASAITGKPGSRGLAIRNGATGRGLVEVLAAQQNYSDFSDASLWSDPARIGEALSCNDSYQELAEGRLRMLTFSIQGFGKVGASFARFIDDMGCTIKMISDVSGTLLKETGIENIDKLYDFCKTGNFRLAEIPGNLKGHAEFISGNSTLPLSAVVNVVVPSALEDVILNRERPDSASVNVRAFEGDYLLQGANGPATAEAEEILEEMGRVSFPDILANSGGVLASYMEWLNGLIRQFGYGKIHDHGFVHPIVENLISYHHPNAREDNLRSIDERVYEYAFRFILRWATVETITLSRTFRITLRTAFLALGMRCAADEGRLSEQFNFSVSLLRDSFAGAHEHNHFETGVPI